MDRYMSKALPFENYAGICAEKEILLRKELCHMESLGEVIHWCLRISPPRQVLDFIHQDEYSIDVLFCYENQLHIVYDTT